MCCIRHYNIDTIVIGRNPYEFQIVLFLGSAFSQVENSKDTPTTSIFASHFKDDKSAKKFLRYSWKYLPAGTAFINVDYYPSSLGGGSSNIYCVIRVNRTVEFLLYCIISKSSSYKAIKIMCAGNLASSCGSTLSKRLRYLGINVTQSNFKQPAYLSRITCNQDLIDKEENYKFCSEGVLDKFKRLIDLSKGLNTYSLRIY